MPIWSFQLILLSVDLIIAALLLVIINNMPSQVVKIDGVNVTVDGGTQKYVLPLFALFRICIFRIIRHPRTPHPT